MARRFTAWQRFGLPMLAGYVAANYVFTLLFAAFHSYRYFRGMEPESFTRTRLVQTWINVLISPIELPARMIDGLIATQKIEIDLLHDALYFAFMSMHLFIAYVVFAFPVFFLVRRLMRRRYRRAAGRCVKCGYDLSGLTGPCASCGRPDDRATTTFTSTWLDRGPAPLFQLERSIGSDVPALKRIALPVLIAYALGCYAMGVGTMITFVLCLTIESKLPSEPILPLIVRVVMEWLMLPLTNAIPLIELLVGRRELHLDPIGSRYFVVILIEWMFWFFYHAIPIFYVSRWIIVARDRRQRGVCVTCSSSLAEGTDKKCAACEASESEQVPATSGSREVVDIQVENGQ